MNRLVIIGNGFDLAHGLNTSYKDFIDWYWKQRVLDLCKNYSGVSEDVLCCWELINSNPKEPIAWHMLAFHQGFFRYSDPMNFKEQIENSPDFCNIRKSVLLERITKSIETKGWTDIESDYYELLKENSNDIEKCQSLNEQLDFLREKLAEYLKTQTTTKIIQGFLNAVNKNVDKEDVTISERRKMILMPRKVDDTMFLNFNYTNTIQNYKPYLDAMYIFQYNHIHGSLDKPKEMIFGYGDEMDKDFQALIDRNENALLENSKSIKYLETSHYRDLLSFIEGGPFQVYIMGHSCGNSDRTLLNTIFEHQNCISIKPFCYFNEKGEDNYSELSRNIYRNFTDKKLFRDRVVNKERCTTLDGQPLVGKD
ncbi:MAG: bacteriophage abortive infection AbiH family protein, partial [Bacteroidales bacterium]|nr:bacteriophage abortive infection AbiH family protein [Bacteroidales bacterium]